MALVGCGAILFLVLFTVSGYLGYRYWSAPSTGAIQTTADQTGSEETDADWGDTSPSTIEPGASEQEIRPHLERIANALESHNLQEALAMALPETREQIQTALDGRPDGMERLGRLLKTARLKVSAGDLAEFEFTEDGRLFAVTFQRVGNKWVLHSL